MNKHIRNRSVDSAFCSFPIHSYITTIKNINKVLMYFTLLCNLQQLFYCIVFAYLKSYLIYCVSRNFACTIVLRSYVYCTRNIFFEGEKILAKGAIYYTNARSGV